MRLKEKNSLFLAVLTIFCSLLVRAQEQFTPSPLSLELTARTVLAEIALENHALNLQITKAYIPDEVESAHWRALIADAQSPIQQQSKIKRLTKSLMAIPKEAYRDVRDIGRKFGSSVVILYCGISASDTLGPLFLIHVLNPAVLAFIEVFPSSTIFTGAYVGMSSLLQHHHLVKEYGGKVRYNAFQNAKRVARQLLNLQKKQDVIFQDSENDPILSLGGRRFYDRIWMCLGIEKKHSSLHEWFARAESAGFPKNALVAIRKRDDLSAEAKIAVLIHTLNEQGYTSIVSEMARQYPEEVIHSNVLSELPALSSLVAAWVDQMVQVKTCSSLSAWLASIPTTESEREISALLDRVALPYLIHYFPGVRIKLFREIRASSRELFIRTDQSAEQWSDADSALLQSTVNQYCKD